MITNDAYFKQDKTGYYDIYFEPNKLQNEWKINIFDIIQCSLGSNKRLPNYLQNQNHINLRGGSPCDMVYNISGKYYGSLIEFYAISNDNIQDKIASIRAEILNTLQDLKDLQFLDSFEVSDGIINSQINSLLFTIIITTAQGIYKETFSFTYGNS